MTSSKSIMILFFFLLLITDVSAISAPRNSTTYGTFYPSKVSGKVVLVRWDTDEGKKRLLNSQFSTDFYQLVQYYQPQINPLFCGIASSVNVLNALKRNSNSIPNQKPNETQLPKALGSGVLPYKLYSQTNFLNERTNKIKKNNVVALINITPENENDKTAFDPGFTLDQLHDILKVYGAKARKTHVTNATNQSISAFRELLKKTLKDSNHFIIANFSRQVDGDRNSGTGHFSPLAAYDEASDSILVLDVATHLVPWYWVPVKDFYHAMNTLDGKTYRGYLIVSN